MSDLTLSYSGFSGDLKIKTMQRDGEVLFSLPDVVQILAKENSAFNEQGKTQGFKGLLKASMEALEEDEKYLAHSDSGDHDFFVTEPGLYRVVSRDLSPASKKFQRWIFHEVLPSIRRHGFYPPPPSQSGESKLKTLVSLLQNNVGLLAKEIEHREALEKQVQEKFASHDERINKLEEVISSEEGFITIENRLNSLEIKNIEIENVWAWCEKIRLEHNYGCVKSINRFDTKYPISLIDQAIGNINSLQNL